MLFLAVLPMKAITFQSKPMVKVAVEPISHKDLNKLEIGLQCLYQFDPAVEIGVEDTGQHTMMCLGSVHNSILSY
jgi:ribosome assembly protein 1